MPRRDVIGRHSDCSSDLRNRVAPRRSLHEVLDHCARGGRLIEDGPHAGDGRVSPFKSEFMRGFELSEAERQDVVAFLESLTDENAPTNKRWSDPH